GMLGFSACQYSALPRPALRINELLVDSRHRRQGVASLLLCALCAQAQHERLHHIELTLHEREPAGRKLVRKFGFARVRHAVTYMLAGSSLAQLAEPAAGIIAVLG